MGILLDLIFVLVVFFFLDYPCPGPCQISRVSALWVRILLLKTFFDGRLIELTRQKVDFDTHE